MNAQSYNYIALNGTDANDTTDAIAARHQAEAEAFLEEHAVELYEKRDRDISKLVYGADYFVEVGGLDDDGEFDVEATIEAHDINSDEYDRFEAHGIYDVSDVTCYAELGTKDQRERARDLILMDTRSEAVRECKAGRAAQLVKRMGTAAPTRAQVIVGAKQGAKPKRKNKRLANRLAGAAKRNAQ